MATVGPADLAEAHGRELVVQEQLVRVTQAAQRMGLRHIVLLEVEAQHKQGETKMVQLALALVVEGSRHTFATLLNGLVVVGAVVRIQTTAAMPTAV